MSWVKNPFFKPQSMIQQLEMVVLQPNWIEKVEGEDNETRGEGEGIKKKQHEERHNVEE